MKFIVRTNRDETLSLSLPEDAIIVHQGNIKMGEVQTGNLRDSPEVVVLKSPELTYAVFVNPIFVLRCDEKMTLCVEGVQVFPKVDKASQVQ